MGSLSTPTSLPKACETTSRPRGMLATSCPLGRRPERSTASMVTAASPSFCAASITLAPPPRSSSILSRRSATDLRARSAAISFFRSEATLSYDGSTPGSILSILTTATPNLPCTGWLASPDGSENAASAIAESMMADFAISPRSTSDALSPRSLARSSSDNPEVRRVRAAAASSAFGKTICDTWRRSGVPSLSPLLEHLLSILVGDRGPLSDLFGIDHDKRYLAIFGRAELGLVIVEIGGQRLRRRRIDGSGVCRVQFDVFDSALFVLKAAECLDQDFRRLKTGRDRAGDLTPQRHSPLVGHIALFGEAELPDRGLEAPGIECAGHALEIGIAEDHAHGLGVGLSEPDPPRFFVQGGLGDGLLQ